MKQKGFVSVELVIVLVVSLLLLSTGAMKSAEYLNTGRTTKAYADTAQIGAAISQYRFEMGAYPANLQKLTMKEGSFGSWLREIPADPWGQAYMYQSNSDGFAVWSKGRDKSSGSTAAKIGKGDIGFLGK